MDRFIGLFMHVIRHSAHARNVQLSPHDVEDLCSEVFVTLLKGNFAVLRHFKGKSALGTYLAVIARRVVVKSIANRKMSEALGHVGAHHSALQAVGVESDQVQRIVDKDDLRAIMDQLPSTEAAIVKLFHLDGKSYKQISEELHIPINSIGPTLHRARERMKQLKLTMQK